MERQGRANSLRSVSLNSVGMSWVTGMISSSLIPGPGDSGQGKYWLVSVSYIKEVVEDIELQLTDLYMKSWLTNKLFKFAISRNWLTLGRAISP